MHGDKRGRELGYPTANLSLPHLFCPRHGIYAVRARCKGDAVWLPGVASLGLRPMFKVEIPLLEVYLLDFDGDLYDKILEVELVAYLREERNFSSLAVLQSAIKQDEENARAILQKDVLSA